MYNKPVQRRALILEALFNDGSNRAITTTAEGGEATRVGSTPLTPRRVTVTGSRPLSDAAKVHSKR